MEKTFVHLVMRVVPSDDYHRTVVAVCATEEKALQEMKRLNDLLDPEDIWDREAEYYIEMKEVIQ